jgi:hypothetical protein
MAIAETIVRQQLGMPEIEIRELLTQYGASIQEDEDHSR